MMQSRIKSLAAIIVVVLVLSGIYGSFVIYTCAENIIFNADAFSAYTDQSFEGVKYNEKMQNDAKKAVKTILGSGISTKVSQLCGNNDIIVCYTRNVYIELDTFSMRPVYMIYECETDDARISADECRRRAVMFVLRNMPKKLKANDASIYCDDIENNVVKYHMEFGNGKVSIAIRMDTGNVIFYDASENF